MGQPEAVNLSTGAPAAIKFLIFSASLAQGSLNSRLAKIAVGVIEQHGGIADLAEMKEFDCPSYNADIEHGAGFPAGATTLRERLIANDAFIIASPEYNGSMPGVLKNAIDWVSLSPAAI